MTAAQEPVPPAFTGEDYRQRMQRVVDSATTVGLAGVLVTPGPDLVWLTGYRPTAITERLTMLVLRTDEPPDSSCPCSNVPTPRRPRACEAADDWSTGPTARTPTQVAAPLLGRTASYGISDSAWAMHLLGPAGRAARHARTGR